MLQFTAGILQIWFKCSLVPWNGSILVRINGKNMPKESKRNPKVSTKISNTSSNITTVFFCFCWTENHKKNPQDTCACINLPAHLSTEYSLPVLRLN